MKRILSLLLILLAMGSAFAQPGHKSKTSKVSLMSFNIRMSAMADYDGINAWGNRKKAVVRMIKDVNPDVMGVQEMLPDQQQYLRKALKAYEMVGVGREDGKAEGECMGVFYKKNRFERKEYKTYWLSPTPDEPTFGWDAACKRTVTFVHLVDKRSCKDFYYFNTHLDHMGQVARRQSILLLSKLIKKEVSDTTAVVILGGDMNSSIYDPIFSPILAPKGDGQSSAKMYSVRDYAPESCNETTYNGYGKETAKQIDYILTNKLDAARSFKTIKKDYGVPYVSDHYPVILIFSLE